MDAAPAEFQTLSHQVEPHNSDTLWPERLKLRETMSQETVDQLQSHFGSSFSRRYLQSAETDVRLYMEKNEWNLKRFVLEE